MATALSQNDTNNPFSDCPITFLLPRTLGFSFSAGAAMSESDDQDYVSSLFNSTALKNSTLFLEHAKMISNSNCSSIRNESLEDGNNVLNKRPHEGQIELHGKRGRQRRPGLPGVERAGHAFNFSAKTTTVVPSQTGTSELSKRSCCAESNNQSWPIIDYSCLEHISDPIEYFTTYRMLENAEKEVRRLKGEASLTPSQSQGRRDRKRRPGLPDLEGRKNVFKFPIMTATVEASQMENSSLSNGLNIAELTSASCSEEISQIETSQTVEPDSKLVQNAGTCDSEGDKEIDELERLLSKCRRLDNDDVGIANFVMETLQINPIHVKSRGLPFSIEKKEKFESRQLNQISPGTERNKIDKLSNLKGRLSLIIQQGDPSLPPRNDPDKPSDGYEKLGSNCKDFCDDSSEELTSNERSKQNDDLEKIKSHCNDLSVDGIAKLKQETLKTKLLDANEMKNPIDHLSALKKPIPLIDIHGRLAKISTLKRNILQNNTEDQPLMFSYDDFEDSSLSKNREMHSLSPVDVIHLDGSSLDAQNTCVPVLSNGKMLNFENEVHSPVVETFETSDPIGRRFSLLEDTCQRPDGTICNKKFVSTVSDSDFEEVGQASALVDQKPSESLASPSSDKLHLPFVNSRTTANSALNGFHNTSQVNMDDPEQILHAEASEDVSLPENPALMDEQLEEPCKVLNGRNKNQGHSEASGGSSSRNLEREEPPCRRRKRNSILRRKSLAGAGSAWESGVRRSTRIRMKPLQYWCGERFLYGRVHDSLATVIGVKKFETPPQNGRKTMMKVKSYVSEEYADLVAQAALY